MSSNGQKSRLGRGLASLIGERSAQGDGKDESTTSALLQSYTNTGTDTGQNVNEARQDNFPSAQHSDTGAQQQSVETSKDVEEYSLKHIGYPSEESRIIPTTDIRASHLNPRKEFSQSELDDLANSIRERGMIQPIVVRPATDGSGFEIVAGERRWRAACSIPLHEVPVIIKEISDQELVELAIIENVQRSDLNSIEEASGYKKLIEKYSYTQETMASVIGKSRSYLANMLRLLNLPDSIQDLVREGELSAGHARALINREDAEELALIVMDQGLSVRETEELVNKCVSAKDGDESSIEIITSRSARQPDVNLISQEQEIAGKLGLKVKIKPGRGETGELRLKFSSFEQFENLKKLLTRD